MKLIRLGVLLIFATIVVSFFIFLRSPLAKPFLSFRSFLESKISGRVSYEAVKNLEAENLRLKSEIFNLETSKGLSPDGNYTYLEAGIYSYFPFNNRGIVAINKGLVDGGSVGMPVLTTDKLIFGKIKSVRRTQSEVITVFDPAWRSAVFLGTASQKAVVRGGTSPVVDLISKDAVISPEIAVLNGSDDLPYGLPLGFLDELAPNSGTGLLRANLKLPYSFEGLEEVLIVTNFP